MKDMSSSLIKMKALQEQFANQYPFLRKSVGLSHFAKYFGLERQSLYVHTQKKDSKRTKVERQIDSHTVSEKSLKKFNKKFLEYLLSLKN